MWGTFAALTLISIILFQFVIARDMRRLVILAVLWLVSIYVVEIITALVIVNVARFYKPESDTNERG